MACQVPERAHNSHTEGNHQRSAVVLRIGLVRGLRIVEGDPESSDRTSPASSQLPSAAGKS